MSFINVIISKSPDIVVAEYTNFQGNFSQISRLVLQKIKSNSIGIIKSGQRKFYFVCEDKVIYLCLIEDFPDDIIFGFLHDLKTQVVESKLSYDNIMKMNAFGLKNLEPEIAELIEYYICRPISTRSGQSISDFKDINNLIEEDLNVYLQREVQLSVIMNVGSYENKLSGIENNINNYVSIL
jgi:hypothetical protein